MAELVSNGSFMDLFSASLLGFIQRLEADTERDSSDDSSDESKSKPKEEKKKTQTLKPHPQPEKPPSQPQPEELHPPPEEPPPQPQPEELHPPPEEPPPQPEEPHLQHLEEVDNKKEINVEEEQIPKSKSDKKKRKRMRRKEKMLQEKKNNEQNVCSGGEQGKNESSEGEETNEGTFKESDQANVLDPISNMPHTEEVKKTDVTEVNVVSNLTAEKPHETIDLQKSTPCISEVTVKKKTKNKNKQKTRSPSNDKQNGKVTSAEPKADEFVTVKNRKKKANKQEHSRVQKDNENNEENMDIRMIEYAKKSAQMAVIGNQLASNGHYKMAINYFTEAIKFNPKEYKLFGNRSFCYEKVQQYEEALSDAEVSLSMDPKWIKGLFRKGKALCGLKKYYEASLAYRDVLKLDNNRQEAIIELKQSQVLHLIEMGFTWTQSANALERHTSLEEAIEALFKGEYGPCPEENDECRLDISQPFNTNRCIQDKRENVPSKNKPQPKEKAPPAPVSKQQNKQELFPVWVGPLASTVKYATLQEVFSRAGKVFSIKMELEQHCAFVSYTRKKDRVQAIEMLNGFVLEGCPLSVQYPRAGLPGMGGYKDAQTDSQRRSNDAHTDSPNQPRLPSTGKKK